MKLNRLNQVVQMASLGVLATLQANAQTSDALIEKLVSKGILTTSEAQELKAEAARDVKSTAPTNSFPAWVNNFKIGGDFRARYDGSFQDESNSLPNRDRFRYRLRIGTTIQLSDHFELGVRVGSGEINNGLTAAGTGILGSLGGSPFSNNSTFNGDGSKKFLFVDLAYAKWTPAPWVAIEAGKMSSPFWMTGMLLDADYTPEGLQERFALELNQSHSLGLNLGQYVIQENFGNSGGNANDVYLFINQVDWKAKWTPKLSSRAAAGMMNFAHQEDISADLERFLGQNGTPAVGAGSVDFNPYFLRGELTYALDSFVAFKGTFPITIGGEYVNNPAADKNNSGYNLGITFGSNKTKGNWQLSYNYKEIQASATWHGLNDDDFGFGARGGADVRGHDVTASWHILNPFTINLRYMNTKQINNAPGVETAQNRVFLDLLWAF